MFFLKFGGVGFSNGRVFALFGCAVNLQYYLSQKIAAPNLYQLDRDERAYYRGQVFRSNQLIQFLLPDCH